jgi:hypothetical protein
MKRLSIGGSSRNRGQESEILTVILGWSRGVLCWTYPTVFHTLSAILNGFRVKVGGGGSWPSSTTYTSKRQQSDNRLWRARRHAAGRSENNQRFLSSLTWEAAKSEVTFTCLCGSYGIKIRNMIRLNSRLFHTTHG